MANLESEKSVLRITTAGSVDDGKSTLIGRLLYESHAILDDQLEALQKQKRIGVALDLSLVTDGLKSEREQGITIDVAYKYFASKKRKFILADAPGHVQYTRNMVTAASRADAAIVLVDARQGVLEQTRRHSYLVHILGVRHVILAINKIDLIGYDQARIEKIERDFRDLEWNRNHPSLLSIPLSALVGDNISAGSESTPWYKGPALLELLELLPGDRAEGAEAQLPVQLILRDGQGRRYASGTLTQGRLAVGEDVTILPSGQNSQIAAIWVAGEERQEARAGDAVAIALNDERDLERGSLILRASSDPQPSRSFSAKLVWFDEDPLRADERYILRLGTQSSRARIESIDHRFDLESLQPVASETISMNDIVQVSLQCSRGLYLEPFASNKAAGAFVLIDPRTFRTVAAGMVEEALGVSAEAGRDGALTIVDRLQDPQLLARERSLQIPRAFLQSNTSRAQQRVLETLLELGWHLEIEGGPEAEYIKKSMHDRGYGVYQHGSGI